MTHSSMPSRRETTGKYWNFKPFLGLKHLQQFLLPQPIAFRFIALFVLRNAPNASSGVAAATLSDSRLTCHRTLPMAIGFARAERQPNNPKSSPLRPLHHRGPLGLMPNPFYRPHLARDSFPPALRLRHFARNSSPVLFPSPGRQASYVSYFSPAIHHSRFCSAPQTNQSQPLYHLNTATPTTASRLTEPLVCGLFLCGLLARGHILRFPGDRCYEWDRKNGERPTVKGGLR